MTVDLESACRNFCVTHGSKARVLGFDPGPESAGYAVFDAGMKEFVDGGVVAYQPSFWDAGLKALVKRADVVAIEAFSVRAFRLHPSVLAACDAGGRLHQAAFSAAHMPVVVRATYAEHVSAVTGSVKKAAHLKACIIEEIGPEKIRGIETGRVSKAGKPLRDKRVSKPGPTFHLGGMGQHPWDAGSMCLYAVLLLGEELHV